MAGNRFYKFYYEVGLDVLSTKHSFMNFSDAYANLSPRGGSVFAARASRKINGVILFGVVYLFSGYKPSVAVLNSKFKKLASRIKVVDKNGVPFHGKRFIFENFDRFSATFTSFMSPIGFGKFSPSLSGSHTEILFGDSEKTHDVLNLTYKMRSTFIHGF